MNTASTASNTLRRRTYKVIFESDTRAGQAFDLILIVSILISTLLNALDTVESLP